MSKKITRRKFVRVTTGATVLAGASWATLGQSLTPRFVRNCIADVTSEVQKPKAKPTPASWKDTNITASWLGHSTVLINFFGLNVITDPVLHTRVGANLRVATVGPKRRVAPALTVKELPKIDLVLLSHAHLDHFDTPTLEQIKGAQSVSAHRTSDLLDCTDFTKKTELNWGEKTLVKTAHGDIEVEAFEVKHWGARWRHDTYRGYNGYILRRGGKAIIFGGDTALCDTFATLKSKGPFELACMPIGAYQPYIWSHCNPEQAIQMANAAGAKYILPMHHTTFRLGRETYTEPLERFETALASEPERIALRHAGETFLAA
jgi:L-ascorbate metabolism protein UlaG (beta-lactamase superfamily)